MAKPNLLLMDEPSNHMDIDSIEALIEGLNAFEGALVYISHNQQMLRNIDAKVCLLSRKGLKDIDVDEYLQRITEKMVEKISI